VNDLLDRHRAGNAPRSLEEVVVDLHS
jgi:hypothetical protein